MLKIKFLFINLLLYNIRLKYVINLIINTGNENLAKPTEFVANIIDKIITKYGFSDKLKKNKDTYDNDFKIKNDISMEIKYYNHIVDIYTKVIMFSREIDIDKKT